MLSRREITVLLFALTVFLVAYNFEASVPNISIVPAAVTSFSAKALLTVQNALREDGRRDAKYTDELEVAILGDWEIDTRQKYDLGPYGTTEDQQHKFWTNGNVPTTELIAHVPGYTILDNVLFWKGTLYLVSDYAAQTFPRTEAMLSTGLDVSEPPVLQDLKFVTRQQAIEVIGHHAHRMVGASLVCFDHPNHVDNQTFLAMQRAYATLADTSSTPLVPPSQTIFANTMQGMIEQTGYSLKLARISFPFMKHLFAEDWDDFERSERPFILDRVLLADRTAAEHGAQAFDFRADVVSPHKEEPDRELTKANNKLSVMSGMAIEATDRRLSFAPPFALPARVDWAAPIRNGALALPSGLESEKRRAVTYVSTQGRRMGTRLREEDHIALVRELRKLGAAQKWDIHVIELGGDAPSSWMEHAAAAAQSSVMLGVFGDSLTNSILLRPGPPTPAVIEFFPDGKYTNEHELVARSLGIQYVAWRNTKKYPRGSLPPISPPTTADSRVLSIDVSGVVSFVKDQMKRSS